jgi:ParB family chromosome partitioning protein
MAKRSGLGKGLNALFIDNNTDEGAITSLKISVVEPNKNQPRADFEDAALEELAESIREHGVLQPIVVRPFREDGGYQIVAGERRWRAARMAGLTEIPVVIRELDNAQSLELAIIENLQREDLNAVELAFGYKALIDDHGLTQEQVAKRVSKSRPDIANTIRILSLPEEVVGHIRSGRISKGHAKALLSLEDKQLIEATAERIVKGDLHVREIERLAQQKKQQKRQAKDEPAQAKPGKGDTAFYREMELALAAELGRRVRITGNGKKATLELEFYSKEELSDIAARLTKTK